MKFNDHNFLATLAITALLAAGTVGATSLQFIDNDTNDYDYARQQGIPEGFGDGEFTMELWIRPYASLPVSPFTNYPIGPTVGQGNDDRLNWAEEDNQPYSASNWWYQGNFLLDGFKLNNFEDGTMALQFYGGGRLRWLWGDGDNAGAGAVRSIGAYPAISTASLLDGQWHQITLVRRWSGATSATLELWIDGLLVASDTSPRRTDMAATFWDGVVDGGWYWGAEKQAAENSLSTYEDYKGLLDEIRYWDFAKSAQDIQDNYDQPVTGTEPGLVGWYSLSEGSGSTMACNTISGADCMNLIQMKPGHWNNEDAPLGGTGGDTVAPMPPTNLVATPQ